MTIPSFLRSVQGSVLESFSTLADWTVSAGGLATNTTHVQYGAAALALTSPSGALGQMTKTISADLSGGGDFRFLFYLETAPASIASVSLYLSSSATLATHFVVGLNNLRQGWNMCNVLRSAFTQVGAESWNNLMIRLRLRVNPAVAQVATVTFDQLESGVTGIPAVVLTFDDGDVSVYTQALPYMATHGLVATSYTISGRLDTAGTMTTAQTQALYAAGWTVGNHTVDHLQLTTLTLAQQEAELIDCGGAMAARGLPDWRHVAYPGGDYDASTLVAMTETGMLTGRTTQGTRRVCLPPSDWQTLECINIANTTTLATAKGYIDNAIANRDVTVLLFHKIATPATEDVQWPIANFQALIDYIVSTGVLVLTIDQIYLSGGHAYPAIYPSVVYFYDTSGATGSIVGGTVLPGPNQDSPTGSITGGTVMPSETIYD